MDPLHETFSFFQLLVLVLQPKAKRAGTLGMNPVLSLPDVTNMQLFHVVYLLPLVANSQLMQLQMIKVECFFFYSTLFEVS